MKRSAVAAIISAVFLVACSKDGSDSEAQVRPSGKIEGVAFDGLIIDGTVVVSALNGEEVARGTTDDKGKYSISLDSVKSQPLSIAISDGSYKEEFSGNAVDLKDGQRLSALINYEQGEDITTSLTYFTSIAAGLAEFRIRSGADPQEAIAMANSSISEMLDIDIAGTLPVDITDPLNASPSLQKDQIYGYFTAAISAYTAWVSTINGSNVHETYNSINFARLAFDDISNDGKLDGVGKDGVIAMGKVQFYPSTYRNSLALYLLVMANHENNRLDYTPADLIGEAKRLNDSAHPMFGDAEIIPLNNEGTIISNPSWQDGDVFYGTASLSVSALDVVGIKKAVLKIGNREFTTDNLDTPTFLIDTSLFDDGEFTASIEITNQVDKVTVFNQKIHFANRATVISATNPAEGQAIRGNHVFSANVADPFGISEVRFVLNESITLTPLDPAKPEIEVNTTNTLATEGSHRLTVFATGLSGYETETHVNFVVDNTAPTLSTSLPDNSYMKGIYTLSIAIDDNLGIDRIAVLLDGVEIATRNAVGTLNVKIDTNTYNEGAHTIAVDAFDRAGNRTTLTRRVNIDRQPPIVNITTASGSIATNELTVDFEASDSLGFGGNAFKVFINDYEVESFVNNRRSVVLRPRTLFLGEGNAPVKITVMDGSGKAATDTIMVNFQHIPTSLTPTSSSTDSLGFYTQRFAIGFPSGRQTLSSVRFNGVEIASSSVNDPSITWTPGAILAEGSTTLSLIHWGIGGYRNSPKCGAVVGTLAYSIIDAYGVTGEGSIPNFTWCPVSETHTDLMWFVSHFDW